MTNKTSIPQVLRSFVGIGLLALLASSVSAEVLIWDFAADEQQVRNGPEADGSTNSPGTGTAHIEYDTESNMLSYTLTWDGLVGDMTKLHLHGPAGSNESNPRHIFEFLGPPQVPPSLATTSGTLSDSVMVETLVQEGFDPIPPEEIIETLRSGQAYLNYHTTVFGTGEIRGNVGLPVPEPGAAWLLCSGLVLLPLRRHRIRPNQ